MCYHVCKILYIGYTVWRILYVWTLYTCYTVNRMLYMCDIMSRTLYIYYKVQAQDTVYVLYTVSMIVYTCDVIYALHCTCTDTTPVLHYTCIGEHYIFAIL